MNTELVIIKLWGLAISSPLSPLSLGENWYMKHNFGDRSGDLYCVLLFQLRRKRGIKVKLQSTEFIFNFILNSQWQASKIWWRVSVTIINLYYQIFFYFYKILNLFLEKVFFCCGNLLFLPLFLNKNPAKVVSVPEQRQVFSYLNQ